MQYDCITVNNILSEVVEMTNRKPQGNIRTTQVPGNPVKNIEGQFTNFKMLHNPLCTGEHGTGIGCICLDLLVQPRLMDGQQDRPSEWIRQDLVDFVLQTVHESCDTNEDKELAGILATLLKHTPNSSNDFRNLLMMMETFPGRESTVFDAEGLLEPILFVALAMTTFLRSGENVIRYLFEGYVLSEQLWLANPCIVPRKTYPLDEGCIREEFPHDHDGIQLAIKSLVLHQLFIHPPWVSYWVRERYVPGRFTQRDIAELLGTNDHKISEYLRFLEEISIPHDLSAN